MAILIENKGLNIILSMIRVAFDVSYWAKNVPERIIQQGEKKLSNNLIGWNLYLFFTFQVFLACLFLQECQCFPFHLQKWSHLEFLAYGWIIFLSREDTILRPCHSNSLRTKCWISFSLMERVAFDASNWAWKLSQERIIQPGGKHYPTRRKNYPTTLNEKKNFSPFSPGAPGGQLFLDAVQKSCKASTWRLINYLINDR